MFAAAKDIAIAVFQFITHGSARTFCIAPRSLLGLSCLVERTIPVMLSEPLSSHFGVSGNPIVFNIGMRFGGATAPRIATALVGPLDDLAGAYHLITCAPPSFIAVHVLSGHRREPPN